MMNSFSFIMSGKHFICPSHLNDSFAFHHFEYFLLVLSSLQGIIWEINWQSYGDFFVVNCFSLAAFKILSLSLTFGILIMMCVDGPLWVSSKAII